MTNVNNAWDDFINLCQHTEDKEQLVELFEFLFTLEEKSHLADRIQLIRELLKGEKTQREIAKDSNISIAKITRGANALKIISDGLKEYLVKEIA